MGIATYLYIQAEDVTRCCLGKSRPTRGFTIEGMRIGRLESVTEEMDRGGSFAVPLRRLRVTSRPAANKIGTE